MPDQIEKYGYAWPAGTHPLHIEMTCIRQGIGKGAVYHYDQMRSIIWPELDRNRWYQLCLKTIIEQKWTVLAGCASSGKSHTAGCLFLCEYWCFPQETCVLVSSTEIRGLKGRIWSEITRLWQKGRDRFPQFLGGFHLDSKISILTDDLGDDEDDRRARDYTKCIQGVPCRESGEWVGLNRYCGWKQKRMRLIADEACFPAGVRVDTPAGPVPIESLSPGDFVLGAFGPMRIKCTQRRLASKLLRMRFSDGRSIVCTEAHPFLTEKGWKVACHLHQPEYIVSAYEAMSIVRGVISAFRKQQSVSWMSSKRGILQTVWERFSSQEPVQRSRVLQSVLCLDLDTESAGEEEAVLYAREGSEDFGCENRVLQESPRGSGNPAAAHAASSSHGGPGEPAEDDRYAQGYGAQAQDTLREWNRTNGSGDEADGDASGVVQQFPGEDRQEVGQWLPKPLQGGCGCSEPETGHRGGWRIPQCLQENGAGSEEDRLSHGAWLDSVEVLQPQDFGESRNHPGRVDVYNLEIEGHPSFSVNGLLVHNSQMASEFINGVTNLNSNPDFKGVIMGNFSDPTDCLGRCAEPVDGWGAHMAPMKTEVWDTFFPLPGKCINLIGFDSPNFDFPKKDPTEKDHYPELIGPKRIAEIERSFGRESWQFYSQCWGAMKISQLSNRVLTREICTKGNAFEEATWEGAPRTRVAGLDSAWGGDRCVFTWVEFGRAVGGALVLQCNSPELVPTVPTPGEDADYAIARWCKQRCEQLGIPPENFFHDSTGRGSLGTALARVWSAQCNPVEFGGPPSNRPIPEFQWVDVKTGERRPKTWREHAVKFVTELWFCVRYCVESGQLRNMQEDVLTEFSMRIWEMKGDKIELEPKSGTQEKPGMKQRTGRSPDLADSLSIAVEGARRRGFTIARLENAEAKSSNQSWLRDEAKKHRRERLATELVEV